MVNLAWIDEFDQKLAKECLDIMVEIVEQMDMLAQPILINAKPKVGWVMDYSYNDHLRERRQQLLEMLVRRGVLRAADSFFLSGREGFVVIADEDTARDAKRRLRERLHPSARRSSTPTQSVNDRLPANQRAALPSTPPADPIKQKVRETHAVERTKLPYFLIGGIVLAVVVALVLRFLHLK